MGGRIADRRCNAGEGHIRLIEGDLERAIATGRLPGQGPLARKVRRLRGEGRLVFLCVHPNERFHLEILEEICERFFFVQKGTVTPVADYEALIAFEPARAYLGDLLTERAA